MTSTTGRVLWGAFGALFLLVAVATSLNLAVLHMEKRQDSGAAGVDEPLLQLMMSMDRDISSMIAATRGFTLTRKNQFVAQYDEAVRSFGKNAGAALGLTEEKRDLDMVEGMRAHFTELKAICDREIQLSRDGRDAAAMAEMLEAARRRRSAYDFAGAFAAQEKLRRSSDLARAGDLRFALTLLLIVSSLAILAVGVFAVVKTGRALAIENATLHAEQLEAQRKVEDLSRLKDEFLSIASHELRTPVTSIKGFTQLAKSLIRENDLNTSEEYLNVALDQIDRMSRLIFELLDVSQIETGRLEIRRQSIRWPDFVRDVVRQHDAAVKDRNFHVQLPETNRVVQGDTDRLDITVHVEDDGSRITTSISDRGIGIPADELDRVFERFHRGRQVSSANYGGLGLGLYIARQIIGRHGGSIWVESSEGHGTTFHFSLPVHEAQQRPARAVAVAC